MKKRISSILALVVSASALVMSVGAVQMAPTTTAETFEVGGTFTVSIVAKDVTTDVTDGIIELSYNKDVVNFVADTDTTGRKITGVFNAENGKFAFASDSVIAEGAEIFSLDFEVIAEGDASITVKGEGFDDAVLAVEVAAEETEETSTIEDVTTEEDTATEEPTEDTATEEPTEDTATEETTEDNAGLTEDETTTAVVEPTEDDGNNNDNPGTGVALAVVPVAIAAAAAIVSKKRK